MEVKKLDMYKFYKKEITKVKNKECLEDFIGKDAATVLLLLLGQSKYDYKDETLLPVNLTPKITNEAGLTLFRLRQALSELMFYNLVKVDLTSPRIITVSIESVEKFGLYFRRRVREYNSYSRMSKEELMKILLTKSDNDYWLSEYDESVEEEEF